MSMQPHMHMLHTHQHAGMVPHARPKSIRAPGRMRASHAQHTLQIPRAALLPPHLTSHTTHVLPHDTHNAARHQPHRTTHSQTSRATHTHIHTTARRAPRPAHTHKTAGLCHMPGHKGKAAASKQPRPAHTWPLANTPRLSDRTSPQPLRLLLICHHHLHHHRPYLRPLHHRPHRRPIHHRAPPSPPPSTPPSPVTSTLSTAALTATLSTACEAPPFVATNTPLMEALQSIVEGILRLAGQTDSMPRAVVCFFVLTAPLGDTVSGWGGLSPLTAAHHDVVSRTEEPVFV